MILYRVIIATAACAISVPGTSIDMTVSHRQYKREPSA